MKLFLNSIVLVLGLACFSAHAISASSDPIPGVNLGIAYKLPNHSEIFGQNYDVYMHPASTQKILTALAAYLYLGRDFKIRTTLKVNRNAFNDQGALKISADGTLLGGITIRFSGDPTLTSAKYRTLLNMLKKAGVKKITGGVHVDVSRFGGRSRGQGWSWDDLPVCFTAPASSVIINRNCVFAQLQPHGIDAVATPIIPVGSPISITSDAVGIASQNYGGNCELEANLYLSNEYHITGCVPIQKDNKPWPLSLSVSDPEKWGLDWTALELKQLGIAYDSIDAIRKVDPNYADFSYLESAPMKDLVRYMLQKSNNLYADAIIKNVAAEFYNESATYYRAISAMRSILQKYAGLSLGDSYQVDGSGLSPHNLITPHQLLNVITYISENDDKLHLLECFPVAAQSGTLQWRGSVHQAPLAKNVIAKTGALTNISNLAGVLTTKSGVRVPFVFFTNGISLPQKQRDAVKYHRIASPTLRYERYVLEQIYNESVMGQDF